MPAGNANKKSGLVQKRVPSKVTVKNRIQTSVPNAAQNKTVKKRGASKTLRKGGPKTKGPKKERPKAALKGQKQLPRKMAKKKELQGIRPQSRVTVKTRLQIPVKSPLKNKGAPKRGRPKAKKNNDAKLASLDEAGGSGVQTRAHSKPEDEPNVTIPEAENDGPSAGKRSKRAKKARTETPQQKESNYAGVQTRASSKIAARAPRQGANESK